MFPNCRVIELIGRGGMGAVYRGVQTNLERPVAIKILPPELAGPDSDFAERFQREAKSMARLTHPNIVSIFDAGETESGFLYLVMELVDGTDVARIIATHGPIPSGEAIRIVSGVCDALTFTHASGIIHRDISPSNIMVDRAGAVKVADFGLAKLDNDILPGLTSTNVVVGKPDFVAPEMIYGDTSADARSDIYAIGVCLYQMITGKLPRGNYASPSRLIPSLPRDFDTIIDRALEPNPESRYSSTAELKRDLQRIARGPDPGASPEDADSAALTMAWTRPMNPAGRANPATRTRRSAASPIVYLLLALVVLLGTSVWWINNKSPSATLKLPPPSPPEETGDGASRQGPGLRSISRPSSGKTSVSVPTQTSQVAAPVQFQWKWSNPLPQGNHIAGLLWDGRHFLAVGDRNTILRSKDGMAWESVAPAGIPWIGGIAHNGSLYVLVGSTVIDNRPIRISEDGVAWTSVPLEGPHLEDVIWTGKEFVAVGWSGAVARSDNGREEWRWQKLGNSRLNDAAYNGSQYVLVGDSGSLFVSGDSSNWKIGNLSVSEDLNSVQWSGDRWIATGENGITFYSQDGMRWVIRYFPDAPSLSAAHKVGENVLVGGESGWMLGFVPPGEWMGMTTPTQFEIQCITHDQDRVVAGGKYGTLLVSQNGGRKWERASKTVTERDLSGIASSPTGLVAVGSSGTILHSSDTLLWESVSPGTGEDLAGVIWTGEEFLAVGGNSTLLTSRDGLRWKAIAKVPSSAPLLGVSSCQKGMVAVGLRGTILSSRDGQTWTVSQSTVAADLHSVTWTGNEFVAVGENTTVIRSPDGIEWNAVSAPAAGSLWDVAWTGEQLLAVGDEDVALSTSDFKNWSTGRMRLFTGTATSILHHDGVAMAAGFFGSCSLSADFEEWTGSGSLVEPTGNHLNDHVIHEGKVVAVGDGGTILVAPWIGSEFLKHANSQ